MKRLLILIVITLAGSGSYAQKLWTDDDRNYTTTNLKRTRDELTREVETLTLAQWAFHESADRWSIAEVVEHLALWEIIWAREISIGIGNKPVPELNQTCKPDRFYTEWIMEIEPHKSPDYSRPTGFIDGKNNLAFFLKLRQQTISFVETTTADMRAHFNRTASDGPRNMHQTYIFQWGHVDRHLRQIRKIKQHPNYPSATISTK